MTIRFSDRMGITKPPMPQVGDMNEDLRNSLWNIFLDMFDKARDSFSRWPDAARVLAVSFFKVAADVLPSGEWDTRQWVKERFYRLSWFQVYNLLEYVATRAQLLSQDKYSDKEFREVVNLVLTAENAGYRVVGEKIEPITDDAEVKALESALAAAQRAGFGAARSHLDAALRLLAQKPVPDYRNAIKEAISAVESAAKVLSDGRGKGLDGPLTELASKTGMHRAMRDAFVTLYGYTSDSSGIRHALLDAPKVDVADARFMVIACSAFVHFLIEKADAAGLLKKT